MPTSDFYFLVAKGLVSILLSLFVGREKKRSINTKCNKRKWQTDSDRLSSYHFLLWRNSICPFKLEQNIEKMFPNELANQDAKGTRAELWRGYLFFPNSNSVFIIIIFVPSFHFIWQWTFTRNKVFSVLPSVNSDWTQPKLTSHWVVKIEEKETNLHFLPLSPWHYTLYL